MFDRHLFDSGGIAKISIHLARHDTAFIMAHDDPISGNTADETKATRLIM